MPSRWLRPVSIAESRLFCETLSCLLPTLRAGAIQEFIRNIRAPASAHNRSIAYATRSLAFAIQRSPLMG